MKFGFTIMLAVASLCAAGSARADGDAAAGKTVFAKCGICHSVDSGVNKIGPSLHGIVGRHSASIANFSYSPAMKATNWDWTDAQLDTYLADPRAVVQGTKMIFPGLKNETDRANVIAYLNTLK